jgi:hypothetical protein
MLLIACFWNMRKYSDIASDYRINQGRIADLKFGRIFQDVIPADLR